MTYLVSILIPAYNAEKWIKKTIESVLAQTWENKEIIVVDDGSRDKTLELARAFASQSVRVVTQNNRGGSAARNTAFELSKGDYIQWLDADDLLAPNKITEQMKFAKDGRLDLTLYSAPHGLFFHRYKKAKLVPNQLWQDLTPIDWLIYNYSENAWLANAGWLVSRRLTEQAGPWDERLSVDDDGEYFARVVARSDRVKYVPEARCYYRQSSFNQVSRDKSKKGRNSLFLATTLRIQHLLALEDSDRTKKASLALLRTELPLFFPEDADLVRQLNALSLDLGGEVARPRIGRRPDPLQIFFGHKKGKELVNSFRKLKLAMTVIWDSIMEKLGR